MDEHRFVSSSSDNDIAYGAISDNTIVTNDYVTKIWLRYSERLIIRDSEGDSSGLFNYTQHLAGNTEEQHKETLRAFWLGLQLSSVDSVRNRVVVERFYICTAYVVWAR